MQKDISSELWITADRKKFYSIQSELETPQTDENLPAVKLSQLNGTMHINRTTSE